MGYLVNGKCLEDSDEIFAEYYDMLGPYRVFPSGGFHYTASDYRPVILGNVSLTETGGEFDHLTQYYRVWHPTSNTWTTSLNPIDVYFGECDPYDYQLGGFLAFELGPDLTGALIASTILLYAVVFSWRKARGLS